MNFKVGQKVVCVKPATNLHEQCVGLKVPQYGEVVTIYRLIGYERGELYFELAEYYPDQHSFLARNFRPLSDTSIEEVISESQFHEYETVQVP